MVIGRPDLPNAAKGKAISSKKSRWTERLALTGNQDRRLIAEMRYVSAQQEC
jgi:hypothetical protein